MDPVDYVEKHGVTAQGKTEYIRYLQGEAITRKEAMLAMCYQCSNLYLDGRLDCENKTCPLYPYMPYAKQTGQKQVRSGKKKVMA